MSDQEKPPSIVEILWMLGLAVFRRESVMIVASIAVMLFIGAAGVVWAETKLDGGVGERLVPIEKRTARVEEEVVELRREALEEKRSRAELERRMANLERLGVETSLNVKAVAEKLKVDVVTLDATKDGGR